MKTCPTALDVLRAARARLSDPAMWTKGAYAIVRGERCEDFETLLVAAEENLRDVDACCAVGAVYLSEALLAADYEGSLENEDGETPASHAVQALADASGCSVVVAGDAEARVVWFNDTVLGGVAHDGLLAWFDRAIAAEAAKGGAR